MHRALHVGNRILAARTERQKKKKHRHRLKKVEASIDATTPVCAQLSHMKHGQNLKKRFKEKERKQDIASKNDILLRRMTAIASRPNRFLVNRNSYKSTMPATPSEANIE